METKAYINTMGWVNTSIPAAIFEFTMVYGSDYPNGSWHFMTISFPTDSLDARIYKRLR